MTKSIALMSLMLLAVGSLGNALPAAAGTQDHARVALHARPAAKLIYACTQWDPVTEQIPCSQFTVSNVPLNTGQFVYLVVGKAGLAGVGALSCGIRYDASIVMQSWHLCAGLEFPRSGWPASAGGNRILWDGCQQTVLGSDGVHAVAGMMYVYAYASGIMEVTPNFDPAPGAAAEFTVSDCAGGTSDLYNRGGSLGFGTSHGYNPCWILDGGCDFMGIGPRRCCCKPGSAEYLPFLSAREQFCEHEGGTIVTGPCESTCDEICTPSGVPVHPISWGRIKSRY